MAPPMLQPQRTLNRVRASEFIGKNPNQGPSRCSLNPRSDTPIFLNRVSSIPVRRSAVNRVTRRLVEPFPGLVHLGEFPGCAWFCTFVSSQALKLQPSSQPYIV
ncbi:hypothetical protein I7I50_08842 [Histoplasma capsulatum G186AR]|uniref:Uncharacterized protein n=1 Tax=Ajellomyces capsulatus TaxID=5037 RepID=A0A8H8D103_AJECA|nr:hypothetical protein I7I52_06356 [Histoplasma capsulatum]QSS73906.1 hypothetical protein I7I50_08842 [Histoplasma capsulatum G186AR]